MVRELEGRKKMNYIIEVEDSKTDTLEAITEALNDAGIRCYVYEETKEKEDAKKLRRKN